MNIETTLVGPRWTIRRVMEQIDRNGYGLAVVVDDDRRLLDTVTDGDVRRAILNHSDLDLSIETLMGRERLTGRTQPVTAPAGTPAADLLRQMSELGIRHVPLLDREGRVMDVAVLWELVREYELPITAVIMAGGYGARLRPLTDEVPKTMLPVGDRPVLERIVGQLRESGIRRMNVTTHYKKEVISEHFGDGHEFGIEIQYVEEDRPLGTAGALSLVEAAEDPILVINGDILTGLDFRAMLDFHRDHQADMTVAVKQQDMEIPFGVVEVDGVRVTGITEKPTVTHFINAGIYLLDPTVRRFIPRGQPYDMPDLIARLVSEGLIVVGVPVTEYWMDIGRVEDYRRAQTEVEREGG